MSGTSPAPWTVTASGGARTIVARDRSVVAVVVGSNGAAPFDAGNGALMAAAPDGYALARKVAQMFGDVPSEELPLMIAEDPSTLTDCVNLARAFLAKAEGR